MVECSSCGAKNTEGREFCRVCGDILPVIAKGDSVDAKEKKGIADSLKEEFQSNFEFLKNEVSDNTNSLSERIRKLESEIAECANYKQVEKLETKISDTEKNIAKEIDKQDICKNNKLNDLIEKKLYTIEKSTSTLIESRFERLNQNCSSDLQKEKENLQREIAVLEQKVSDLQNELALKTKKKRTFFGDASLYEDSLNVSAASRWLAFVLCALFGILGMHRFYVGKTVSGIVYILTCGAFGIGVLVDLAMIAFGSFKDKDGLLLKL